MKRDLARMAAQLLNTPLAITPRKAEVLASVFSGRLNISALQGEFGTLDRGALEQIQMEAKFEADAKRAEEQNGSIVVSVGNIAVIQIWGTLTRTWGIGTYSDTTGYDGILMQLEAALADDDIKGIWFDVDSGGGTINGMFDLGDAIYSFRQANGGPKPIWAMASDYAYSAAYLLASAADRLIVPPTGGVGSVGIIGMHTSYAGMLDKAGIKVTVIREPELKAKPADSEDMDPDSEKHIRDQIREVADLFQAKVARNMGLPISAVAATKGLDYMGRHAKAIGFATDVLPEPVAWEEFKLLVAGR